MTLEPGRYQIRVGVRDSNAQVGTVFYDLVVPDFRKDPVMMSGLLLTAASAGTAMTAQPDPDAPKVLPGPATSRRIVSQNDTLTVFAEIYDNISSQQPRQIETVVSLTSETGQEVFNARDSIPNPSTALGQALDALDGGLLDRYGFAREVPLKDVAAGTVPPEGGSRITRSSTATAYAKPVIRETLITVQR